jgi:hypothetical protein
MVYDLMVVARLKENAQQLKKLFKGLNKRVGEFHYGPLEHKEGRHACEGACHGVHDWSSVLREGRFTKDWWQVTCLVCISTHFSRWKRGEGSAAA